MDDIKWAEPPAPSRPAHRMGRRKKFVLSLQSRPGEWAQYQPGENHSPAVGSRFRRDFPGVEATSRVDSDGNHNVYVRWVGNGNGDTAS